MKRIFFWMVLFVCCLGIVSSSFAASHTLSPISIPITLQVFLQKASNNQLVLLSPFFPKTEDSEVSATAGDTLWLLSFASNDLLSYFAQADTNLGIDTITYSLYQVKPCSAIETVLVSSATLPNPTLNCIPLDLEAGYYQFEISISGIANQKQDLFCEYQSSSQQNYFLAVDQPSIWKHHTLPSSLLPTFSEGSYQTSMPEEKVVRITGDSSFQNSIWYTSPVATFTYQNLPSTISEPVKAFQFYWDDSTTLFEVTPEEVMAIPDTLTPHTVHQLFSAVVYADGCVSQFSRMNVCLEP